MLEVKNLVKSFECVGVAKIYMSSVGVGKFLTEIVGDTEYNSGTQLREAGHEYGLKLIDRKIKKDSKIKSGGLIYLY